MFDFKNAIFDILSFLQYAGLIVKALIIGSCRDKKPSKGRKWFQRPGISSFFQTELRKGYEWDRDFVKFNQEITDANGNLIFSGPFCRADEMVEFSKQAGVDHTVFQTKWHDGLCFWDTQTTHWKTERDYTQEFADKCRESGIPFMFYYSKIFDHNPQFDSIQPNVHSTASLIGNIAEYREVMCKQYDELITKYKPDGMWIDWYWADGATSATIEHIRSKAPNQVITFNLSNLFPSSFRKIDFTSSEAHSYNGPFVRFKKEDTLYIPVLTSAVLWANTYRMLFEHQWEVCSPTGKWWEDNSLRDDKNELLRSIAMILACGGKFMIGVLVEMDGSLTSTHVEQWKLLGEWYKPRKSLFGDATAFRYRWFSPPGVRVSRKGFDLVASHYAEGKLLHIINPKNLTGDITVELTGSTWRNVSSATLMPSGKKIAIKHKGSKIQMDIGSGDVELVDTILYLE